MLIRDMNFDEIVFKKAILTFADLTLDPKNYQYKVDCNSKGVREKRNVEFKTAYSGAVTAHAIGGKLNNVNGHHRYNLAEKCGCLNEEVFTNIMYIDIDKVLPKGHEYVTQEQRIQAEIMIARMQGAFINLAEGNGTLMDVAKLSRDGGVTKEDFIEKGIEVSDKFIQNGLALAGLHKDIYESLINNKIKERQALIIGKSLSDKSQQKAVYQLLSNTELSDHKLKGICDVIRNKDIELKEKENGDGDPFSFFELFEEKELGLEEMQRYLDVLDSVEATFNVDSRAARYGSKGEKAKVFEKAGANIEILKRISKLADDAKEVIASASFFRTPLSDKVKLAMEEAGEGEVNIEPIIGFICETIEAGKKSELMQLSKDDEVENLINKTEETKDVNESEVVMSEVLPIDSTKQIEETTYVIN